MQRFLHALPTPWPLAFEVYERYGQTVMYNRTITLILSQKCNTLIRRSKEKKSDSEWLGGSGSVCEMILDKNPAGALSTAVDRDIMQHTLQFLVPNTDSSAMALSAAIFELIKSPAMRHRLRGELSDYSLESDNWSSLTKLPYLVNPPNIPIFRAHYLLPFFFTGSSSKRNSAYVS